MRILGRIIVTIAAAFMVLIAGFNLWGFATLGTLEPELNTEFELDANRVVMVFGATGSVGDGLLKAAMEDPDVERIYVVTRRGSERIDDGAASGRLQVIMQEDFTDYSNLADILGEVNTVLWGLGTTSIGMDDETYTWIHVDFPVSFVKAWLAARTEGPMAFHYVTGMGTDPEGGQHWAREKGRAINEIAAMAEGTGLRSFDYRSAWVRPTSEQANALIYAGEFLLRPGYLVIPGKELGQAMLEISVRTAELPNGTLIDNKDSIDYARAYAIRHGLE